MANLSATPSSHAQCGAGMETPECGGGMETPDPTASQLRNELHTARETISRLEDELNRALNQIAASEAAVAKLSGDISELAESLKTARTQLDAVFRSRSWRWLEPIRRANFLLKSHRKKARAARMRA